VGEWERGRGGKRDRGIVGEGERGRGGESYAVGEWERGRVGEGERQRDYVCECLCLDVPELATLTIASWPPVAL
jgi:hypothetical protein